MSGSDEPDVTIAYRRSGGLAGIDIAGHVYSRDLSPEDAQAARSLFAAPPPPASTGSGSHRADQFEHELALSDGTSTRIVHWSDAEVPETARTLVAMLARHAEPTRPPRS